MLEANGNITVVPSESATHTIARSGTSNSRVKAGI